MDQQQEPSEPQSRRYPPRPLKVERDDNTALFVDTDGTVYRKYYDPVYGGGIGREEVGSLRAKMILRRGDVQAAIARAWDVHEQVEREMAAREAEQLAQAALIVEAAKLSISAEDLVAGCRGGGGFKLADGTRLILLTSPDGGPEPQWTQETQQGTRTVVSADQAADLLSRLPEISADRKASVRVSRQSHEAGRSASRFD